MRHHTQKLPTRDEVKAQTLQPAELSAEAVGSHDITADDVEAGRLSDCVIRQNSDGVMTRDATGAVHGVPIVQAAYAREYRLDAWTQGS
jgi:hypothetical protein